MKQLLIILSFLLLGCVKSQTPTESVQSDEKSKSVQSDEKCYVDVKSSEHFNSDLISSISVSLISDFVRKITQTPPEGISLKNSCIYYINAQKQEGTTIVTISGQGINSYGDSKLEGMDGFQKSLLKSLYRSVENKIKLCQKYGNYLEECFEDNVDLIETGEKIRLKNVLGRKKVPLQIIKEKRPLKKGIYVSVEDKKYNYSYDRKNWVKKKFNVKLYEKSSIDSVNIISFTYGNGLFLAVGNEPYEFMQKRGKILVSVNGEEWEDTNFKTRDEFVSVSYAKGIYFVMGKQQFLVSEDGYNWININHSNIFGKGRMRYLKIDKIKIVNNKIFGIGDGGIFTMNDDLTWNSHLSFWNKLNDQYSWFYRDIAYGNGKYVAIGWESGNEDSFTVSEDGEDWDYYNVGKLFPGKFWGITYGMGIFVAVGSYGNIFVSEDGTNWSPANFVDNIDLIDVIFANNAFIAVSIAGKTIISEDGVNWDYVGCNCGGEEIIFRPR